MLRIAMIPIDNRPVCYCLPEQICAFSNDVELLLPPRTFLGGLTTSANTENLLNWLKKLETVDILILALDTIAYGGLVASRRTEEKTEDIEKRLLQLKNIIIEKNIKTYACSSIMRISNNNINEEEKIYWDRYGKKIFDYSFNLHKAQKLQSYDANEKFSCISKTIPEEILQDYLDTRKRNFDINKTYLNWQKEGIFDYLVFSKDDCAQYGLNVAEAEETENIIQKENLNAIVKTGADEIPLSLLTRALSDSKNKHVNICPKFIRPDETNLISKYEDVSIFNSVKGQIELCGCNYTDNEKDADIILIVNNFENEQGELVMNIDTQPFNGSLALPDKPYIIADVAFANGADNNFVKALFDNQIKFETFLGYAGWNTSANTIGSAICAGLFKFLSTSTDKEKFKIQQFTRFADDWAYQANCRKNLKELTTRPDTQKTEELMTPYINIIEKKLQMQEMKPKYTFPWDRFFEIEITI